MTMSEIPGPGLSTDYPANWQRDEVANTLTHGLGFLLSLGAWLYFWMATSTASPGLRITCMVFAATLALVYLCSTLSHAILHPYLRRRMRAWDQGSIYLLIAGTYSPFVWYGSPQGWMVPIMAGVWLAAAWGFILKVLTSYRVDGISTVTYVLLGWVPAVPLFAQTPAICLLWMVLGGVSYTAGIVFLMSSHRAWFTHSIWHIAVILGSLCHCIAINHLLQLPPP